jgi:hypothetical protein
MAIENHSPEAAYASKDNIVVPVYVPDREVTYMESRAAQDLGELYGIDGETLGTLMEAAKSASDASDTAVQADGGAAGGTKAASTASKAAVDALNAFLYRDTPTATDFALAHIHKAVQ